MKAFKKLTVLLLALTMVLGMSVAAFADGEPAPEPPADPEASKIAVGHNEKSGLTEAGEKDGTSGTPTTSKVTSNVEKIYLIKTYPTGDKSDKDTATRPDEIFTFTITPIGAWHVGHQYDTDPIPALGKKGADGEAAIEIEVVDGVNVTTLTVNATNSKDSYSNQLTLPDYKCTGDYWYMVKEANNKTTGITYAINSGKEEDGKTSTLIYYIHVQVVNGTDGAKFRSVTLHTEGPTGITSGGEHDADYEGWVGTTAEKYTDAKEHPKLNDITNEYNAGTLTINKQVTGNAGETAKNFTIHVILKKPAGTIITSTIKHGLLDEVNNVLGPQGKGSDWMTKKVETVEGEEKVTYIPLVEGDAKTEGELYYVADITLRDGQTYVFNNIPVGVTYTVTEEDPKDGHINQIEYISTKEGADRVNNVKLDNDFTKTASGDISDPLDAIRIRNDKSFPIDVGVILESAPFVAILIVAVAVGVVAVRRKRVIED